MRFLEDPAITVAIDRQEAVGSVIEFAPLALEGEDGSGHTTHRRAALATLAQLKAVSDAYFEGLLRHPEYASRKRDEFFRFSIDEDAIGDGEPVPVEKFLGRYCDITTNRLLLRGKTPNHVNDLFWFGDHESSETRIRFDDAPWPDGGLSGAYIDPPYGLHGTREEVNAAFFGVLDALFGGMRSEYTIYRWSDEASNYFDAGKEWWGTYFWTVHEIGTDRIVGIAASATD